MRILFINNGIIKPEGLEGSFIRAFKKLDIDTNIIYPNEMKFIINNKFNLLGRILNKFYINLKRKEKTLFQKIQKENLKLYDIIFIMKGTYITPESLDYIKYKNNNIKLICFNPDDPYNKASSNKNIINSISKYDIYFIWSKKLVKKIEEQEKIKSYYIPFAADLELHNKNFISEELEKKYPISFIGNWDKEREKWLDKIKQKNKLILFGNNWGYKLQSGELKQCYKGFQVTAEDFTKVALESIININILRFQNKNSNNMRTFEIPASGGFLLHEYSEEVAKIFEEGKEIEFFRNEKELNEKIDFYLKNPNIATQIGLNAYNKIINDNLTYDKRIEDMIRFINEL